MDDDWEIIQVGPYFATRLASRSVGWNDVQHLLDHNSPDSSITEAVVAPTLTESVRKACTASL